MRLWSIHPKYLDRQGLVALWREGLLAKAALSGKTSGYKKHPQLVRFKSTRDPVKAINAYLKAVLAESIKRGYCFSETKVSNVRFGGKISVTKGQLEYEFEHLKKKFKIRSRDLLPRLNTVRRISPHPMFTVVQGKVEVWERI